MVGILTAALRCGDFHSYFSHDEAKAQRTWVTQSRPHKALVKGKSQGPNPRVIGSTSTHCFQVEVQKVLKKLHKRGSSFFFFLQTLNFLFCIGVSFQFSRSVVSYSSQSHGLQHARLPCPSPTPGTCSNSCPLSW